MAPRWLRPDSSHPGSRKTVFSKAVLLSALTLGLAQGLPAQALVPYVYVPQRQELEGAGLGIAQAAARLLRLGQAGDAARLAALPLLRWRGEEALERLMADCRQAGALLFNPHVISVEDGGLGVVDADQVAAKAAYDPAGLLNPGKLRGWLER